MKYVYNHFDEWLAATILAVMTLLAFANVVSRYALHMSISATEEITTSLMVLLSFLGAAVAAKRKGHLGLSVLVDFFPRNLQRYVAVLGSLLGVALCVIVVLYGIDMAKHSYEMEQLTIGMQWPEWIYASYVPLGCAVLGLRFLEVGIKTFKETEA